MKNDITTFTFNTLMVAHDDLSLHLIIPMILFCVCNARCIIYN